MLIIVRIMILCCEDVDKICSILERNPFLLMMTINNEDNDDNDNNLARLLVLASLPARRGVFGVDALVRPTPWG